MSTAKITEAMRDWCGALSRPDMCRWIRRGEVLTVEGSALKRAPRAAMVCQLEAAGLIEWDQLGDESTARLTTAGQRAGFRSPTVGRTINLPSPFKRKRKSPCLRRFEGQTMPPDEVARLNAIMAQGRAALLNPFDD
jgi:hypothetical protein